jgi:hypothetical protein
MTPELCVFIIEMTPKLQHFLVFSNDDISGTSMTQIVNEYLKLQGRAEEDVFRWI